MTCERRITPEEAIHPVKGKVAAAVNRVVDAKNVAPGSDHHIDKMRELTDLLANNSDALDALKSLQNGS